MRQYHTYLRTIKRYGNWVTTRTGVDCFTHFGHQMRFNMREGFPLVTTKFTAFKTLATELCWFLGGGTNIDYLQDRGCHIWDEWADANGNLGPVYGAQWRTWGLESGQEAIDQIAQLEDKLANNPTDRRMIVSAWNVAEVPMMGLPACHLLFQCHVAADRLSLQVYQRSCDSFLGVPFNIASYGLLLEILALRHGYVPGDLVWTGGDCHIYENHFDQVDTVLSREPLQSPRLWVHPDVKTILLDELEPEMFEVREYEHHGKVSAPVAV